MKHHLNTLFITTEGSYLAKEGEAVLVRVEKQTKLRVPIHTLGGIVCFGRVGVSPSLMGMCGQRGVAISLLTTNGLFLARINGFTSGNVLLRREQYRRADDPGASAAIARAVVIAKVANGRSVLLRNARDYPDSTGTAQVDEAAARLADTLRVVQKLDDLDSVRGMEGDAANAYFGVFDHLITNQKEGFAFTGRSRRPPLDNVNALLSFLYAMLGHDARSACEAAGLDPQVGFLHRDRPGRAGLALDLMEELRPVLADRLALSLINRRQVDAAGFVAGESGGISMTDATRKAVLVAYQKRKQEEIMHPFLNEKVSLGLLVHLQARLLARHLRGDCDAYPAFIWKG
jgi:CRISPR-associated protein Cas1